MPYTLISQGDFIDQLAARLNDSESVFWTRAELSQYLNEALQLLGVAGLYFRERVTFPTVANQVFYDLKDAVDAGGATVLQRTTTDRNVVNALEYHLQEPINDWSSATWGGSAMFTMDDLVGALQRRVNQYLLELRRLVFESVQTVAPNSGRVAISQSILDTMRAVWARVDNSGAESKLQRLLFMDEQTAMRQSPRWTLNPAAPQSYSIVITPTLQVQLVPAPNDTGHLYLYSTVKNADLDVATGITINLPNGLVQFCKWGALADLLGRDGEGRDPQRSAYAQQRYDEGVQLGRIYTSLINVEINGVPAQIVSADDLDSQIPRWQTVTGRPGLVAMMGLNLVGFYRVPDGVYAITGDVVRNAILPASGREFLQVGAEWVDVLLDYCEHVALFKCGGMEFQATMPHYERFMKMCADYNSKLKAASEEFEILASEAANQEKDRPRRAA